MMHGKPVTDEQIQAWADEAEAGYDLIELRRRGGRPTAGDGPGVVVPVRLDAPTLAKLDWRIKADGFKNRSEALRAAIVAWVNAETRTPTGGVTLSQAQTSDLWQGSTTSQARRGLLDRVESGRDAMGLVGQ